MPPLPCSRLRLALTGAPILAWLGLCMGLWALSWALSGILAALARAVGSAQVVALRGLGVR